MTAVVYEGLLSDAVEVDVYYQTFKSGTSSGNFMIQISKQSLKIAFYCCRYKAISLNTDF